MDKKKKKTPDLRFDFTKAVNETLRDYPDLARKVIFVDVLNDNEKQGLPEAVRESEYRHPARRMEENLRIVHTQKSSLSFNKDTYGTGALLYYSTDHHQIFSKDDKNVSAFASFDHELGHLLTKGGFANGKDHTKREVAADSYAVIRNIQRFGSEDSTGEYAGFKRALNFVIYDNPYYLTTFAIDAITADIKNVDFSKLSPQETVEKADAYAKAHTLGEKESLKLHKFFFPVRGILAADGDPDAAMRALANLVLDKKAEPEAFYLGKRVIDGLTAMGELKGPAWDEVRKKLAAKAAKSGTPSKPGPEAPKI